MVIVRHPPVAPLLGASLLTPLSGAELLRMAGSEATASPGTRAPDADGDRPVIDLAAHTAGRASNPVRCLRSAGEALAAHDFAAAADSYREAMRLAPRRTDPLRSPLYREAAFGYAALAEPATASELASFLSELLAPRHARTLTDTDRVRARLLLVHALSHEGANGSLADARISRASDLLDEALRELEELPWATRRPFQLAAQVLSLELLLIGIRRAHAMGDQEARAALITNLHLVFDRIKADRRSDRDRALIADYEAEAAIRLARIGRWMAALQHARTVCAEPTISPEAAARILEDPLFAPFVRDGRFLSHAQIVARGRKASAKRRFKAAIAHANVPDARTFFSCGAVGAVAGTAAGRIAGTGPWTFVATGIGAALAVGGYRIVSGWRSDEAGFDCAVPEKKPLEGDIDMIVRLVLQGAVDTFLWGSTLAVLTAAAHLLMR